MPVNSHDRAAAIYSAIASANPQMAKATDDERAKIQRNIETIFGGDLDYLVRSVTVVPASFQAPAGASVQVAYPGGAGATTSAVGLVGQGKIS